MGVAVAAQPFQRLPDRPERVLFSSGVTLDRLNGDLAGFGSIAPLAHAHPLFGFQILVVGEEVLDLLEDDVRQICLLYTSDAADE